MLARGESSPASWWRDFCHDHPHLQDDAMAVFQRLSQATERFRPDEWRRDPAFLKIWLAYLETHL